MDIPTHTITNFKQWVGIWQSSKDPNPKLAIVQNISDAVLHNPSKARIKAASRLATRFGFNSISHQLLRLVFSSTK